MDNFYAYKAENPSGVNSSLCYEGGGRLNRDRGVCTRFLPRGEGGFYFGVISHGRKDRTPLTLVQFNFADVPGYSNKKTFFGKGMLPPSANFSSN